MGTTKYRPMHAMWDLDFFPHRGERFVLFGAIDRGRISVRGQREVVYRFRPCRAMWQRWVWVRVEQVVDFLFLQTTPIEITQVSFQNKFYFFSNKY